MKSFLSKMVLALLAPFGVLARAQLCFAVASAAGAPAYTGTFIPSL